MAIQRIYLNEHHFVLTIIYGKLTNAELGEHVVAMNEETACNVGMMELADCRYLTDVSELSAENLMIAASMETGQARVLGGKGAIVVASDTVYGLARVYAAVASDIREDSQVFRDMEQAMAFLGVTHLRQEILAHVETIVNPSKICPM